MAPPPCCDLHALLWTALEQQQAQALHSGRLLCAAQVLGAREEAVQAVLREAHARLAALSQDKQKYRGLLTDLLAQVGQAGRWIPGVR